MDQELRALLVKMHIRMLDVGEVELGSVLPIRELGGPRRSYLRVKRSFIEPEIADQSEFRLLHSGA